MAPRGRETPFSPDAAELRGHIIDSSFHGSSYATAEGKRIFCDLRRIQRWLEVEAALALCQGRLGIIPRGAAREIARRARLDEIDLGAVRADIQRQRHSLQGVIDALGRSCRGGAGQYVHYGATTQDIQDTAQSLELKDVYGVLGRDLARLERALAALARRHRRTLMAGRTHGQFALPTTFGLKVASWLDEVSRGRRRLESLRREVLVAQLFGGAGTQAGLGPRAPQLLRRFSARLGLGVPAIGWHSARDRVAAFGSALAILAGGLGRIGNEVFSLRRAGVGELRERGAGPRVGSSTMPHKRNAIAAEQLVVLARLCSACLPPLFEGLVCEHERDGRALRLEWAALPTLCMHACAAAGTAVRVVEEILVDEERMAQTARGAAHLLCSEALMFAAGRRLGKQTAHHLLHRLYWEAREDGRAFHRLWGSCPELAGCLSDEEFEALLDVSRHLGTAVRQTDAVLRRRAEVRG